MGATHSIWRTIISRRVHDLLWRPRRPSFSAFGLSSPLQLPVPEADPQPLRPQASEEPKIVALLVRHEGFRGARSSRMSFPPPKGVGFGGTMRSLCDS